jgi:hypothetical protein
VLEHLVVVQLAPVGDHAFDPLDLVLQVEHVLLRAQLRVGLGHGEQ